MPLHFSYCLALVSVFSKDATQTLIAQVVSCKVFFMKKSLIVPVLASMLLACGVANAEQVSKCGGAQGKIFVTGQGEVKVMPDRVLLNYRVSSLKPYPDEARQEVEKTVTSFSQSVQDLKLGENSFIADDITIMPRYEYKDSKQTLIGYEASRNVQIKLSDFALISKITDKAIASGINQIAGFVYQVAEPDKYKAEAAQKAIASVKDQAKMLADGFDVELDTPCSITYNSHGGAVPIYRNNMAMAMRADVAAEGTTNAVYSPEPLVISASISAEYAIKKK